MIIRCVIDDGEKEGRSGVSRRNRIPTGWTYTSQIFKLSWRSLEKLGKIINNQLFENWLRISLRKKNPQDAAVLLTLTFKDQN